MSVFEDKYPESPNYGHEIGAFDLYAGMHFQREGDDLEYVAMNVKLNSDQETITVMYLLPEYGRLTKEEGCHITMSEAGKLTLDYNDKILWWKGVRD